MESSSNSFDVIVIGGGPAGLSAGIVASIKGLKAAVFEGGTFGGLLSTIYPKKKIFNYLGTPRIRADHLVSEWVRQAADHDVVLIRERISEQASLKYLTAFFCSSGESSRRFSRPIMSGSLS